MNSAAQEKVKVAIVGCGGIANGKHLPSLSRLPNVEFVSFCDIIPEKAEAAKAKYGTEASKVYADYKELIAAGGMDVVQVCTPNDSHAPISIAAMEAGYHVMSEKPMAKTAEAARQMRDTAQKTGQKLTVGYNNRFRSDSQYLKQVCESGQLGEIYFAKAHAIRRRAVPTWGVFLDGEKQGGGPLIDIGTHALDLTLWMMDNYEVKSVVGNAYHKLSQKENAANAWASWDPAKFTVEDSAFGFITMKNNATVILEASWALNTLDIDEAKCTLCGTEGGADMKGGLRLNGESMSRMYETQINLGSGGVAFYEGKAEKDADLEMRLWIDCIQNNKTATVTPEQACVVSEVLEAIYKSSETGKAVYFD